MGILAKVRIALLQLFSILLLFPNASVDAEPKSYLSEFGITTLTLENGTRVESFRWGKLDVVFDTYANEKYASTVRIMDQTNNKLLELRSYRFIVPSYSDNREEFFKEYFIDLFGKGESELKLTTWSGGAYGQYTDLIYSYSEEEGLRNLLTYRGGESRTGKPAGVDAVTDQLAEKVLYYSGEERIPELIIIDHGAQDIGSLVHGSTMVVVLKWNGREYRNMSNDYSIIPHNYAMAYRSRLSDIREVTNIDMEPTLESNLIGFISNSLLAGEEAQALEWLKENCANSYLFQQIKMKYLDIIKERIKGIDKRIGTNQSKLIEIP